MMSVFVPEEPLLPHPTLSQQHSRSGELFFSSGNELLLVTRFIETRGVGHGVTEGLGVAIDSAAVVPVGVEGVLEHHYGRHAGRNHDRSATIVVVWVGYVFADLGTVVTHFGHRTVLRVPLTTHLPLVSAAVFVVILENVNTVVNELLADGRRVVLLETTLFIGGTSDVILGDILLHELVSGVTVTALATLISNVVQLAAPALMR